MASTVERAAVSCCRIAADGDETRGAPHIAAGRAARIDVVRQRIVRGGFELHQLQLMGIRDSCGIFAEQHRRCAACGAARIVERSVDIDDHPVRPGIEAAECPARKIRGIRHPGRVEPRNAAVVCEVARALRRVGDAARRCIPIGSRDAAGALIGPDKPAHIAQSDDASDGIGIRDGAAAFVQAGEPADGDALASARHRPHRIGVGNRSTVFTDKSAEIVRAADRRRRIVVADRAGAVVADKPAKIRISADRAGGVGTRDRAGIYPDETARIETVGFHRRRSVGRSDGVGIISDEPALIAGTGDRTRRVRGCDRALIVADESADIASGTSRNGLVGAGPGEGAFVVTDQSTDIAAGRKLSHRTCRGGFIYRSAAGAVSDQTADTAARAAGHRSRHKGCFDLAVVGARESADVAVRSTSSNIGIDEAEVADGCARSDIVEQANGAGGRLVDREVGNRIAEAFESPAKLCADRRRTVSTVVARVVGIGQRVIVVGIRGNIAGKLTYAVCEPKRLTVDGQRTLRVPAHHIRVGDIAAIEEIAPAGTAGVVGREHEFARAGNRNRRIDIDRMIGLERQRGAGVPVKRALDVDVALAGDRISGAAGGAGGRLKNDIRVAIQRAVDARCCRRIDIEVVGIEQPRSCRPMRGAGVDMRTGKR